MTRRLVAVLAAVAVILAVLPATTSAVDSSAAASAPSTSASTAASARAARTRATLPGHVQSLKLPTPLTAKHLDASGKISRTLADSQGPRRVVVRLAAAPAAKVAARGGGPRLQRAAIATIGTQQDLLIAQARRLDPALRVLGRTSRASDAVMLRIDSADLAALAADPSVVSVTPVVDYHLDLSETVPYVGAAAVQAKGFTGKGVRVAVLDSGVDYTHKDLGGPGTVDAYLAAYGDSPGDPANRDPGKFFPTKKVIGGYDYVGESWPDTQELADPDPIDCGGPIDCTGGHGTHVADIIAGKKGVAPDALLYAVKVCSSNAQACSGAALLEGFDFALDPNGDGNTADHVDVVNLSLGSAYNDAYDDDLSFAIDAASKLGVLTVAAAGNDSDKPYVLGTPAAAPSAIAVAQTEVPSASLELMTITSPAAIAGDEPAVFQPWSAPLAATLEAPIQLGDGVGGNANGCDEFSAGSLTGKIVLVDRGDCFFSVKVSNIEDGGGLAAIIGLVTPGEPFEGGSGGGKPAIPAFMISQANATAIKAQLAGGVTARLDPSHKIGLVGHVVGSSSRGPALDSNLIKPDIGAPGASVSALVGTGDGTEPFGGTSGAAPMVTGAAALLRQAFPTRTPYEIKSLLMDTAETGIINTSAGTGKAPITRIGGGELRVSRALASPAAAWDAGSLSGSLSFGERDVQGSITLSHTVVVRNYSPTKLEYRVRPTFRFTDDRLNGAVTIATPPTVIVPAKGDARFNVTLSIDGTKLRDWSLDSGAEGASSDLLSKLEYDGYVLLDDVSTKRDDAAPLHLAWEVLPRKSGHVVGGDRTVTTGGQALGYPAGQLRLSNYGVGTATLDSYSLVATSPRLRPDRAGGNAPVVDLRYVGVQTFPVDPGVCSDKASFVYAFAISTWERITHANGPAEFDIYLDVDRDGVVDYVVFNFDADPALTKGDGRNVTWVLNLSTGDATAEFYTDQGTNSSNTGLFLCGDQIGLTAANFGQPIDMAVAAVDNAFTGRATDIVSGLTVAPLGERYVGLFGDPNALSASTDIAHGSSRDVTIVDFGTDGTNPSETGVLLVTDGGRDGYRGGAAADNETIVLTVKP